ncbi:MAG: hypothetical protein A2Y76_14160 [Planctomycetes bacterium RBG_13_60_9]|nr:MAG: hypothetical protein A2Y76_14160 [Planctomycetes bacterium RBG_13_60_9]
MLFVLLCGTVALSANQPARQPGIAERIEVQEARLPQIEAVAAREREGVEQWYQQRRAEVTREVARRAAARIRLSDRALWTEFARMQLDLPPVKGYLDISHLFGCDAAVLRQAMIQEYFINEMADVLLSDEFERELSHIVTEHWDVPLLPLLRDTAQGLLALTRRVRAEVDMELRQLENQKKARLNATMEWERDLKEQVRGILEYLRQSESRQVQLGVVESVGYSPKSGHYCMIEGVDRVLAAGDRVGDIRIVKIDSEKVEFVKDETAWAQKLGAPASPFWR